MDIYRVIVISLLLSGCTAPDKKPDPCKSEYANTVSHCRKAKKQRQDLVLMCQYPTSGIAHCAYVPRDELRDLIRGMARP